MYEFVIKRGEFPNQDIEHVTADFLEADDGKVYLADTDGVFPPSWVFGEEPNEEETPIHIFDDRVQISSHNFVALQRIEKYKEQARRDALSEIDRFCEDDERFGDDLQIDTGWNLHFLAEIRICGKWVVGKDQKGRLLDPYPSAVWGYGIGDYRHVMFKETETAYLREIFKPVEKTESEAF